MLGLKSIHVSKSGPRLWKMDVYRRDLVVIKMMVVSISKVVWEELAKPRTCEISVKNSPLTLKFDRLFGSSATECMWNCKAIWVFLRKSRGFRDLCEILQYAGLYHRKRVCGNYSEWWLSIFIPGKTLFLGIGILIVSRYVIESHKTSPWKAKASKRTPF